ncbi:serine/threonine-protein kinase [Mycobacterium sp. BK086]|uniref:Stk1 family PASTA domain-containing Ser/Thr kinase n=1 Tax=Mycobacterium sp. BK086 TaxID=2512165 RepID=UPI001061B8D6|nr:Stk1 family PASTA domain-containing Ser/Thr kinase [Mycobacterium sp. BK086]TDO06466.1 serine/threonine-protein kinase [Mycobacterium sp. BK086]
MTTPRYLSDRYVVGEILGVGGMSEVHLARDMRLHRDVAVKVLRADLARDPRFYLRFRREAKNAAALNHPAIVAVYDTGEAETDAGPLPYIVMEYVEGVSLRDIVHTGGPMAPARAIEVIADAASALDFSHQHGIIHRDVKPANIMISKTGAVKVMDFGIAHAIADVGNRMTQTAAVIGTAQYLSPEQARGERGDARSDVYSLGCVLYEILTGEPPFVGDSPVAVAYQHVREDPLPPSHKQEGISPDLDAVVLKALAKNPENRYQSAADMRTDLIRVHSGQTPTAPKVLTETERSHLLASDRVDDGSPPTTAYVASHGRDRDHDAAGPFSVRRWLIVAAVLAVLTVVVTVATTLGGGDQRNLRVPDLRGQPVQDAITTLQNRGFKVRDPVPKSDSAVPSGHVINTDPNANATLAAGDEISINVSSGPEQHPVPSCSTMTAEDCARELAGAGFVHNRRSRIASTTVPENFVIDTIPAANQSAAITTEIVIEVSAGAETRRVPDVSGQTVDEATQNLKTAGFPIILTGPADSTRPAGQVAATDPPAGASVPVDSAITVKVSLGNQIPMPNLTGMTYFDVVPYLQGLGLTGPLLNSGDIPGPDTSRNRVVKQDPPAGTSINRSTTITLNYGS